MGKVSVLTVAAFLFAPVAQAQEFSSPEDLLSSLYHAYLSGYPVTNFEPYFSDRLTETMRGGRLNPQALRSLGFDPMTGTENPGLMTVFNLKTLDTKGVTATSVASFLDDGVPVTITFELVREPKHGWQIDHISGTAGNTSWCSSDLAKAVRGASER